MNSKEILIFDIQSEYGHFRKYNTTTSPLPIPSPPERPLPEFWRHTWDGEGVARRRLSRRAEPVQEFFSKDKSDIAVQIMRPVKKENIGFNLINTKIGIHIIQFQLEEHKLSLNW